MPLADTLEARIKRAAAHLVTELQCKVCAGHGAPKIVGMGVDGCVCGRVSRVVVLEGINGPEKVGASVEGVSGTQA